MWEHIPEEMVCKSFLKCGTSNKMDGTEGDALNEDFLGECVAKMRMWTMTVMLITRMILLLHLRFWNPIGPAFSRLATMIPILRDFIFNPIKPTLQKLTLTYMVSICLRKELQVQKYTSTYLQGHLIREYLWHSK